MELTTRHKVLIIAYYFPPMGLSGVQRTLKFVKYLPLYGWDPTVLTVEPRGYFARDEDLLQELEATGVEIVRTPSLDPLHFFRNKQVVRMPSARKYNLLSRIGQCFFIPDNKIGWKRRALSRARQLINRNPFDLIYATAPPYTDFLIGRDLKKEFRIPLVIDYRDAWLENPLHRYCTPLHRLRHHALEKSVLQRADGIVAINRRIKELVLTGYEEVEHREVTIIPQGFDQEDFDRIAAAPEDGLMRFLYAGTFYYNRSPRYFLEAFHLFLDRNPGAGEHVVAEFAGHFGDENIQWIRRFGLDRNVVMHGYLPHREVIALSKRATVLWMMLGGDSGDDMMSTGKLFEYVGSRKPILGCVPDGIARSTIEKSGAGFLAHPTNPQSIAETIGKLYELYRTDSLPKIPQEFAGSFERKFLTGELAKLFHSLVDSQGSVRL